MQKLRWGIVGTGFIANVVAEALERSESNTLVMVASRTQANAERFARERANVTAVQGTHALLCGSVDAVYVATPTSTKEAVALSAIEAGKHILVDKPFIAVDSAMRMTQAAKLGGSLFMDATHFSHHPRTAAIRDTVADRIGDTRSLHTSFYFPTSERDNIRLDPMLEPMGALGDMGWYSMRAVVEYLQPCADISSAAAVAERDARTGAVIRTSGQIAFADGKSSTFDVGYTAGTVAMDFCLMGTHGIIDMDDFVLDWTNSFAFNNRDIETGFSYRTGLASRSAVQFVRTQSDVSQQVRMLDNFATAASSGDTALLDDYAKVTLTTQGYLDALWQVLK